MELQKHPQSQKTSVLESARRCSKSARIKVLESARKLRAEMFVERMGARKKLVLESARKCSKVLELCSNEHFYMFRIVCVWFAWFDTFWCVLTPIEKETRQIMVPRAFAPEKHAYTSVEALLAFESLSWRCICVTRCWKADLVLWIPKLEMYLFDSLLKSRLVLLIRKLELYLFDSLVGETQCWNATRGKSIVKVGKI